MRGKFVLILGGTLLAAAGNAFASDQPGTTASQWFEEFSGGLNGGLLGDAGQFLPPNPDQGNLTRGAGPLTEIRGRLVFTRDVDLFCINITDPASFTATMPGSAGIGDSVLYLFDTAGHGIAANDNDPAGGIGAKLTGAFVPAPGLYFLGASRISVGFGSVYQSPLNGAGAPMFPQSPNNVEYGPISAADVLTGWSNNPTPGFGDLFNFNYTITLTGAGYHQVPASSAGLVLALGGLAATRRRR